MKLRQISVMSAVCWAAGTGLALAQGQTLTMATGNKLNWVVLEENVLRQRATTDIATKGGQFDIITIGSYEAPIWGKQNWLLPVDDLGADYDYADIIPSVKSGL